VVRLGNTKRALEVLVSPTTWASGFALCVALILLLVVAAIFLEIRARKRRRAHRERLAAIEEQTARLAELERTGPRG
jgi:cytochrome c-type biogenesis protein CcmH/NrfF